jgi:hypothetical protein
MVRLPSCAQTILPNALESSAHTLHVRCIPEVSIMSAQDILIVLFLVGVVLLNLVLSGIAIWRAKGFLKLAAAVPVVALAGTGAAIVIALDRDPTAHNLWPIEIAMVGGAGILWSITFLLVTHFIRRRRAATSAISSSGTTA